MSSNSTFELRQALPLTSGPGVAVTIGHARATARLASIDILRGLVIVLMVLDHVRDYFTEARFDPLDLTQTNAAYFATRWITHFCAPIFIMLAGVSAYLVSKRCTRAELSRFLLTRGLWLVALEFTVVHASWFFNLRYDDGFFMQVIWAIGMSMVVLAALVHLPVRAIGAIALAMIVGHNLLDGIAPERFGALAPLWNVLHVPGNIGIGLLFYPLIPWVGVMAAGFVLGAAYDLGQERRRYIFRTAGILALGAFFVLRYFNIYGDPQPWTPQATFGLGVMSFLDVEKYPPSLLYVLMTLGTGLLLLGWFESARGRLASILETFGRVPLFVYLLHIVLAHLGAGLIALAMGHGTAVLTNIFAYLPAGWGFGLFGVYVAWFLVLAALYSPARWFAGIKRRRRDWWLSYV